MVIEDDRKANYSRRWEMPQAALLPVGSPYDGFSAPGFSTTNTRTYLGKFTAKIDVHSAFPSSSSKVWKYLICQGLKGYR